MMRIRTAQELGNAIRARRKQLRVSQKDLAMTCGTGLRFVSDLENGKMTCQIGKILDVLEALGLAVDLGSVGGEGVDGQP